MSTSLAEQLRRLAVPQTSILQSSKKRPSLLFDPKDAANLTKETVYQIGLDGLEELKKHNAAFEQFEITLFHITSKGFERSVESAETNQRLDKNIRKFLLLLSPYFLFNYSYKALEWLVHRYYIHEYNKEDLLMLVLPYHETNIFVRVLQLLNLKEPNDKWGWLRPLQKPRIHLPKQTLYNHAASDVYFLQFVSNFVLSIIKEHENPSNLSTVFNFYWTTFTGALENCQEVREGQVSQMLPVLLKGLTSKIPDFTASSYIIVAKLVTKTDLSDKILEKLVKKVSLVKVDSLLGESILVLVVLYQAQKQFTNVPNSALKNICRREGFAKGLQNLNDGGVYIYPFLKPLVWNAFRCALGNVEDSSLYTKFIDSVMDDVKINDEFVEDLLIFILDTFVDISEHANETFEWLRRFMKTIERRHPVTFDSTFKKIMTSTGNNNRIKALRKLIYNFTDISTGLELFEHLYHPNSSFRIEGLRLLKKNHKTLMEKESQTLQDFYFDRLDDEDAEVVKETLMLFNEEFSKAVDMERLKDKLVGLLNKGRKICNGALKILCRHYDEQDVKVMIGLWQFLLPTTDNELKMARSILSSDFAKTSKILHAIKDELLMTNDYQKFCAKILDGLQRNKDAIDIRLVVNALKEMGGEGGVWQKYVGMILLGYCLPDNCNADVSELVLSVFETFMGTSRLIVGKAKEDSLFDFILQAKQGKLTVQSCLYCLKNLILKTENGNYIRMKGFYLRLLKIILKGCLSNKESKMNIYFEYLKLYYMRFCNDDVLIMIELLLNISINEESEYVDDEFRMNCVKVVKALLDKKDIHITELTDSNKGIVLYILAGLNMPNDKQRVILLEIVDKILKRIDYKISYRKLLDKLIKYQEEILLDHEQISLVIFNILNEGNQKDVVNLLITTACNDKYPLYLKSKMMSLLTHVNDGNIYKETSKQAMGILNQDKQDLSLSELEIIHKNIQHFNPTIACILNENSIIFHFIKSCLESNNLDIKIRTLNQIDKELFHELNKNLKSKLLDSVITIASTNQDPGVLLAASHVFKAIDLDVALIKPQLEQMRDIKSSKQNELKRKRRIGVIPTLDILETIEWKKGVTVLEYVQDKKKIRNTSSVLQVLFEILKKCLDFDEQASVEYPKQLILSTILHFCKKVGDEPLPENAFNVELVVQCVRASSNPQTHHHALVLLSHSASLIPKDVLHHIIAIFTFVGSSVLRHDDAYSFQIITKIIDTIIPILVKDGSKDSIEKVLRVFIDAILDIPEHRRMPLFKQLLERLNPDENLYLFFLIIFEAHVVHGHTEQQKVHKKSSLANIDELPKRLDIASDLALEFPPEIIIGSFIKILAYLRKLPEEKIENEEGRFIFNLKRHTAKQFRHYKYIILTFTTNLLSSPQFVSRIAMIPDSEMLNLERLFKEAILNILNYIQKTTKFAENHSNTPQAQYWKAILHHSYDILDAINALLTNKLFLMVIRGLIVYSLSTVRKRALDLLNNKLVRNPSFINECDKAELHSLIITPILNIIKSLDASTDLEPELIVQKALLSLKLIIKNLPHDDPEEFIQILDLISELIKANMNKINENTLASLILCLAELCTILKAHAISSLNKFMPILIRLLKTHKSLSAPNLLLVSVITAIQKILDSLPLFISPYLKNLLLGLVVVHCKWSIDSEDTRVVAMLQKLKSMQQRIGLLIPLRVLLSAVQESYNTLISKGNYPAIGPLMDVLSESLSNLKTVEIQAYLNELTGFFMNCLQFRAEVECTHKEANEVEGYVIATLVKLTLKLSESTFRPLYYKLYDWAVRSDVRTERIITFYNLSASFAGNLKSLFVLFAGYFLNNAAKLLNDCNNIKSDKLYFESEDKNVALLENLLNTLHAVFLYDSKKFVTKERFDVLMQPVVDQLENTVGGTGRFEKRVKEALIPCIVQFAVATADDALWKQMNYQILLKTRHNSPKIRLIALECLNETAKKLGEDFLPLLPETIPFLAELLEDEDENVEKSCQKAVQEMEKVLGEPLQKYF